MTLMRTRETPKLAVIAAYWDELDRVQFRALFPHSKANLIGFGEPLCFRCGWLPPVKDAAPSSWPEHWKPERRLAASWNAARGWLERAHLHDFNEGGSDDPENLVPMCPLCHEEQPLCQSREEGIAFVNERPSHADLVFAVQVYTDGNYAGRPARGKGEALRKLLRAYANVGITAYKCALEELRESDD